MKEFPSCLKVSEKKNFPVLAYNRVKAYLRRELYEHIILKKEDDYFVIGNFDKKWLNDMEKTKKMVGEVREELHKLGWKTETSFGGTGLFIYSEKKPVNCFPDSEELS